MLDGDPLGISEGEVEDVVLGLDEGESLGELVGTSVGESLCKLVGGNAVGIKVGNTVR